MNNNYQDTELFWDQIFAEEEVYNAHEEFPFKKIEDSIEWLCINDGFILDFGCGDGRVLNRCFDYGAERVLGIDISKNAVQTAQKAAAKNDLEDKSKFMVGGVEELKNISSQSADGIILFNIIDNLKPEDGIRVLEESSRILKNYGRIILKLNPYYDTKKLEEDNEYQKIGDSLYKEKSSLYLWNLSKEKIEILLKKYFIIEDYQEVEFKKYNMINRLYYLSK